jgi:hypothetical protein
MFTMDIRFTTAKEMIETKIIRNSKLIEVLRHQNTAMLRDVMIKTDIIRTSNAQIKILQSINSIEEHQLSEYDEDRGKAINESTCDINEMMDELREKSTVHRARVSEDTKKMIRLQVELSCLNEKIPTVGVATNVRIRD